MPLKESFDKNPKSKYWSSKNLLLPYEVALSSHKKFWFNCDCGHQFEISLKNITLNNNWCSYCANKRLCNDSTCEKCYFKSFACVDYSKFWSKTNQEIPRNLFKTSQKKGWFDCECGHTFEQNLSHIARGNRCPYCSKPAKKLCNSLECKLCFNKSFASIEKSKYFDFEKNKNVKPRDLFKNSAKKFWFNCNKCSNIFENRISHITSGVWCSKCKYKTEDIMYSYLISYYPSIISQKKFDWCKNIKHLPFDFVIEDIRIIIELDGVAHFIQVAKWKPPEHNRKRDLYKMQCANKNGYSIIRILQEDVFHNRFDWNNEINIAIKKILDDNKVQNIYICKKDEYKDFDKEL
jgi:very-short-patch-repair endonuclease/DNA-directed RNA polymerase subunit RPC12/RpoP